MRRRHWMEDAERVWDGPYIGECDYGDLWVQTLPPVDPRRGRLWRRLDLRRPLDLFVYLRSRRARKVVWLERGQS